MSPHEWTDVDDDTLGVYDVGVNCKLGVSVTRGDYTQSVHLTRDETLELYHALGDHLMATAPDEHDPDDQPASIALEAHDAVYGDRQADYGHPREDFTRTAILWTGLLQHLLADGAFIDAADVGRCMIAVKLSRDVNSPKRDNRVDMAGYAITLDRLETGQ